MKSNSENEAQSDIQQLHETKLAEIPIDLNLDHIRRKGEAEGGFRRATR